MDKLTALLGLMACITLSPMDISEAHADDLNLRCDITANINKPEDRRYGRSLFLILIDGHHRYYFSQGEKWESRGGHVVKPGHIFLYELPTFKGHKIAEIDRSSGMYSGRWMDDDYGERRRDTGQCVVVELAQMPPNAPDFSKGF